ncbi:hypothetical protein BDV95DRAFT_561027 [Massariosphaeria phaeospora]|uniref:Uncharacterized protein n=1 Tax=Massariosphaeria phaeospora TaxID=100035 RepID=A0A7C8MIT9_9PLEO|nr:hypothetical protein BDV95DRAFT_561027 [Massariosphaeria phaeospora]
MPVDRESRASRSLLLSVAVTIWSGCNPLLSIHHASHGLLQNNPSMTPRTCFLVGERRRSHAGRFQAWACPNTTHSGASQLASDAALSSAHSQQCGCPFHGVSYQAKSIRPASSPSAIPSRGVRTKQHDVTMCADARSLQSMRLQRRLEQALQPSM